MHHRYIYDKKRFIRGINLFDKTDSECPTGYNCSLEVIRDGSLQVWTDGKYRFLNRKPAIKLLRCMLDALMGYTRKYQSCTAPIGEYCSKHGVKHKWPPAVKCIICGKRKKDMIATDCCADCWLSGSEKEKGGESSLVSERSVDASTDSLGGETPKPGRRFVRVRSYLSNGKKIRGHIRMLKPERSKTKRWKW